MDTIFVNSEDSKPSDQHRLVLNLSHKINLKESNKYVVLPNLSIYYTWKNIKESYKNNNFKISAPTWNDKSKLLDGLYSVSVIQDYFDYIVKKHQTLTGNPPIQIYINKIENQITFKNKAGYYLEVLTLIRLVLLKVDFSGTRSIGHPSLHILRGTNLISKIYNYKIVKRPI